MEEVSDQKPAAYERPAGKQSSKKKSLVTLLIILLIAAGAGAYWWRDKQAKTDGQAKQTEIASLQSEVASLKSEVEDLNKKLDSEKSKNTEASAKTAPSASDLSNIKDSITSGNTAALGSYMADSVRVIVAASEGIGDRTPAQAIGDLQYLDQATDPWDFDLPEDALASYRNGFYTQYFPDGVLVGKSANDYLVAFTFNDDGKISGILMVADANLLQ